MNSTANTWTKVDQYAERTIIREPQSLKNARQANRAAHLPDIDVSAAQGKHLQLLATMCGAKRILEIGTLGGYSTIWLASTLPEDGSIVTLEVEAKHAEVARKNVEAAGMAQQTTILEGPALETLPSLAGGEPFDFIFIDADKPNNPDYLTWALALSRPGTILVADNVVRDGEIIDAGTTDERVKGIQKFIDALEKNDDVDATIIQTVGKKGYDGFLLGIVKRVAERR
ncbi:O-methyltransferase [Aureibacillus halotolerans]|uniref:Putative O-methyltransferase YrrM n=1 Tax=Aureibacillus halotolerans TaxID=1508390 RepID=A0A4R6U907_9BACI|nr:O-methyltransferase [Aureibacillus halotolerans]TDQ41145.1 putative O-methyltransferase YrrM [Aureibacillus halotolerans]